MASEDAKHVADADAKGRILREAVQLFARKGFEATPVREIVQAAEVTKPTLYYHFGSKEGLGHAILTEARVKMEDYLREGTAGIDGAFEKLVGFVDAHFRGCIADRDLALLLYGVSFSPEEAALTLDVQRFREGARAMLDEILHEAAREGVVKGELEEEAALILMGIINIHLMHYLKLGLELSRERAVRAVELFLQGVGKDTGKTSAL